MQKARIRYRRPSPGFPLRKGVGQVTPVLFALSALLLPLSVLGQSPASNIANKIENKPDAAPASGQMLLEQADRQQKNGQFADMLASATRALAMAQATGDTRLAALALASKASALTAQGREEEAAAAWKAVAASYATMGADARRMEALGKAGALLTRANPGESKLLLAQTRAWSQTWRRAGEAASILNSTGLELRDRKRYAEAQSFFADALAVFMRLEPDSRNVANCLNNLGIAAAGQEHLEQADDYFHKALAIRQKAASDPLAIAESWNNLGLNAYRQGDVKKAEEECRKALELRQKAAPDDLPVAESWSVLGFLRRSRGDLNSAVLYFQNAQAIRQKIAPNSLLLAENLSSLGQISKDRGDLAGAEDYYKQSLSIRELQLPGSMSLVTNLDGLGQIAYDRSDYAAAEEYFKRSLRYLWAGADAFVRNADAGKVDTAGLPQSLDVANCLLNLGKAVAKRRGVVTGEPCFLAALAIYNSVAPNSLNKANCLVDLAAVAEARGKQAVADDYTEQSLQLKRKDQDKDSDRLEESYSLSTRGVVALDRGDLNAAEKDLRDALAITQKINPHSLETASNLGLLGSVAEQRGDYAAALKHAQEAWNIVQKQAAQVIGDEARQAFREARTSYANNLMRYQLKLHQTDAALITLEQGRARAMEQLISERRILMDIKGSVQWDTYKKANLAHEEATQRVVELSTTLHRLQRQLALAQKAKAPAAQLSSLQQQVEKANDQVEQAREDEVPKRLTAEARYGDLQRAQTRACPQPLPLMEAVKSLPADSIFAYFSVGDEETTLFLLRNGKPAQVFSIRVSRDKLQAQVRELRNMVADSGSSLEQVGKSGRNLFGRLFPPAAQETLKSVKRWIISPDDMLWEAPFAALVINTSGTPKWLGLAHPLSYSPSLTLFALTHQEKIIRAPQQQIAALVVGDPVFDHMASQRLNGAMPALTAETAGARGYLWENGTPPERLPGTREEATQIAELYQASPLLGEDATEAEVRKRIQQADIIHLATHGVLRRDVPMASGLLLTAPLKEPAPTTDDGAFQAWEMFGLKLKAELVILSACETGKGISRKAEGLIGLTRALQCAGCRSILASQWSVSDASTATLMVALHQNLRKGVSKDVALQEAMQTVAEDAEGRTAHPFYWAAFALTGDPDNTLPHAASTLTLHKP